MCFFLQRLIVFARAFNHRRFSTEALPVPGTQLARRRLVRWALQAGHNLAGTVLQHSNLGLLGRRILCTSMAGPCVPCGAPCGSLARPLGRGSEGHWLQLHSLAGVAGARPRLGLASQAPHILLPRLELCRIAASPAAEGRRASHIVSALAKVIFIFGARALLCTI